MPFHSFAAYKFSIKVSQIQYNVKHMPNPFSVYRFVTYTIHDESPDGSCKTCIQALLKARHPPRRFLLLRNVVPITNQKANLVVVKTIPDWPL